jgi:heterodisulfide reductase subunit A-like polyferredoxin
VEAALGAEAEVLTGTRLASLEGGVGNFTARLEGASGVNERRFGAVVIATGVRTGSPVSEPFARGRVVPLSELEAHVEGLARRDRPRHIAIILDARIEEGKASSETAIRTALSIRSRFAAELSILLHDVRVSGAGLEALYDQARESGISFMKYDGEPRIAVSGGGVIVRCRDSVLGEDIEVSCGLAAVSVYGLPSPADKTLADAVGVGIDALGRMQENNVHLLPGLAGREGVFVVGACRGETYAPSIARDVRDVALSVRTLLFRKSMEVELSHPVVDGDKCVLCLTCVRSCPFRAMRVDAKEKKADCIPEACRKCGICAGECPAKAIELPAHSDRIVLARAGA